MTFERQLGVGRLLPVRGPAIMERYLGGHLTVMKVVFKQHLFVKESDVGTLIFRKAETT